MLRLVLLGGKTNYASTGKGLYPLDQNRWINKKPKPWEKMAITVFLCVFKHYCMFHWNNVCFVARDRWVLSQAHSSQTEDTNDFLVSHRLSVEVYAACWSCHCHVFSWLCSMHSNRVNRIREPYGYPISCDRILHRGLYDALHWMGLKTYSISHK